ncbi:MAG: putative Se/S carrier-like protein [Clostridia bacterium]
MKEKLIIVGSITYALKAKDILLKHGIKSYIERNTKTREYGCGYSIFIPNKFEQAETLLREFNVKILAIIEREG